MGERRDGASLMIVVVSRQSRSTATGTSPLLGLGSGGCGEKGGGTFQSRVGAKRGGGLFGDATLRARRTSGVARLSCGRAALAAGQRQTGTTLPHANASWFGCRGCVGAKGGGVFCRLAGLPQDAEAGTLEARGPQCAE